MESIQFYIDYIFMQIINDVQMIPKILNYYQYYAGIVLIPFFIAWIWLKNLILTAPIWILFNMTFGRITFYPKPRKKSTKKTEHIEPECL